MKITDIETVVVTVPLIAPIRVSQGVVPGSTRTVIKIHTDEKIVGVGETVGSSAKSAIDSKLKPLLIGADPFQIETLLSRCNGYERYQPFLSRNMRAFAGIEIALWDLMGKSVDKPVHSLIGGLWRDRVAFSGYWYPRYKKEKIGGEATPEAIASYCKESIRRYGFTRLEGKVGIFPPSVDIATVEAIRSTVGPEVELGVDPNGVWSPETAIPTIRKMDRFDLCNVEEPCRELDASARVRSRVEVPLSTHCPLVAEILRLGVADVMVGDPYEVGGILVSKKLVAACELQNLGYWIHSALELGVSLAANIQICASSPHIIHPSQGTYEHLADDIIRGGKFEIKNGSIKVPTGPGLGVEIDEKKLDRYHRLYEEEGEAGFAGYSTIGSDPERPGWSPSFPEW